MTDTSQPHTHWKPAQSWITFILLTIAFLWLLHALAFFPHEYAHSTVAWLIGWKNNPLDLCYGHFTIDNILIQSPIYENVNYDPIFAGGHGVHAAIIAAAGVVIGNGLITYTISRWGYAVARRSGARTWGLFFYWLCVASVGNFLAYVPVRTFSMSGDMHTITQGLHCSSWWIIVVLGIPFGILLVHFFVRFAPAVLCWLFPQSAARRNVMVVLTTFAVFGFYGAAGWGNDQPATHMLSVICVCVLLPIMLMVSWWLTNRPSKHRATLL